METKATNQQPAVGAPSSAIIAWMSQIVIDAAQRGNIKLSMPAEVVRKVVGEQVEVARKLLAQGLAEQAVEVAKTLVTRVEIKVGNFPPVKLDSMHCQVPDLVHIVQSLRPGMRNVMLVGPCGSGKTRAVMQVSESCGFGPAFIQGQTVSRFEYDGFVDAHGVYHSSTFRRFCEAPKGVYLQDEIDSSDNSALLALKAFQSNGCFTFPDGKTFQRTPDHYIIAAANTYGTGANRRYCGRTPLDAATLDEYRILTWKYDEDLEARLVGNAEWHSRVKSVRWAVDKLDLAHPITPRNAMRGADEIRAGSNIAEQELAQLRRGLMDSDWQKVIANAK